MKNIRTHYDNLKVARNAPPEVIRAAYRSLSLKYHPDKNSNNSEAQRISTIINIAYEILSDPVKRKEHDRWIELKEKQNLKTASDYQQNFKPKTKSSPNKKFHVKIINILGVIIIHFVRFFWLYLIGGLFVYFSFIDKSEKSPNSQTYKKNTEDIAEKSGYVRSNHAPNGVLWPGYSSYITDYPLLLTDGLSSVTIDNSKNDSDVFVKLVSLYGSIAYPVRQFYITEHGKFTLGNINAGTYDIRYRDLKTGYLSRSESFELKEIETYNGIQYSNITMTLYKVQHGNMETYPLSEDEF